ncbi:ATP-binding protein [Kerstersia similis]|uniref:ATP-binding protein n=1 Tax=Kerstersia similis TaxID=206505 RepID=UPI0039F0FD38
MSLLRRLACRYLVPRSLRARVAFLVLGAVLFSHTVTMLMIDRYQERYVDPVKYDLIITALHTLQAAVAHIEPDERADFVRRASHGQWYLWNRQLPADVKLHPHSGMSSSLSRTVNASPQLQAFVERVNASLGDGTLVAASQGQAARLYISLSHPQEKSSTEWLVVPLDRLDPPLAAHIIVIWLLTLSGVLMLAGWFSWHISRPMTRLAEAADQLAAGKPSRVQPSGPDETRLLGERFNAMLDALAESDAVRRTLLAGLPHDLKGPLSRMWLRIEMSSDPTFCEGMRKDLQDMQHMIGQFLDFVRGSDPAAYRPTTLEIRAWLQEYVKLWHNSGLDITLHDKLARPVPLRLDDGALRRLLDNLVSNAMHHGQPPIRITLETDTQHAHIILDDHGPGIPVERRHEALRPFLRLDDARTRTGNVGLGLALADTIARAHHGVLQLDDAPGGGLRVRVSIPLSLTDEQTGSDSSSD